MNDDEVEDLEEANSLVSWKRNDLQHFLTILTFDLIFTSNRYIYVFTLGGLTREQHLKLKTQQKQYVDAKEKLEAQLLKLKEQRESLKEEGAVHEDKIMKENHKLQVIKLFLVSTFFFSGKPFLVHFQNNLENLIVGVLLH